MPFQFEQKQLTESHRLAQFAEHEAYLYSFRRRSYIEPKYGYVLTPTLSLIDYSIPYSSWTRVASLRHVAHMPSPVKFLLARAMGGKKIRHEESVISLRFLWDYNYFHFYNDVLAKLALLSSYNIDVRIPLVISKGLAQQQFFQEALKRSRLQERPIIVQDGFYIEANEVIFCMPLTHQRPNLDYVLDLLNVPPSGPDGDRRVYLSRAQLHGRYIMNGSEIESICARLGFETVDTGSMSLDQQIDLFSKSRYVVGIHGAGLANILFRRGRKLGLLEIFPPGDITPSFAWLCHQYGYDYDAVQGYSDVRRFDRMQPFKLDPQLFAMHLSALLGQTE